MGKENKHANDLCNSITNIIASNEPQLRESSYFNKASLLDSVIRLFDIPHWKDATKEERSLIKTQLINKLERIIRRSHQDRTTIHQKENQDAPRQ